MKREVCLVVGVAGEGKTEYARRMFQRSLRALVLDADFEEFPAQYFETSEGALDWLEKINAFENRMTPFRVGFTPLPEERDWGISLAMDLRSLDLFLEEADRFDPGVHPSYSELISRGRHFAVNVYALCVNPFLLDKDLRRQMTRLVAFMQTEPDDIDWLAKRIGKEAAYKIPTLPEHHYLEWTPRGGAHIRAPIPM